MKGRQKELKVEQTANRFAQLRASTRVTFSRVRFPAFSVIVSVNVFQKLLVDSYNKFRAIVAADYTPCPTTYVIPFRV